MIAIIGLGMVGYELAKHFSDYEVLIITRSKKGENVVNADITNRAEIAEVIRKFKPEFVVNTAAITNVDLCEVEKELAYKVNAIGAKNVGEVCKEMGIKLCHISTDYVFDGERGNYSEEDEINPVNYYGYTKAEGERFLLGLNHDTAIVRISVPYCLSPIKENFFTWVLKKLSNDEEISVITDQWVTPTYVKELCFAVEKIFKKDVKGTLHVGGGEKVNRFEFALKVAEVFGLEKALIKPIKSSDLKWKAKRPKDTSLNSKKAERLLGIDLKPVSECLKDIKKQV